MAHTSLETLAQHLKDAHERVTVGARYAHYKHPEQHYLVTSLAVLEATEEIAVIYEAQYGDHIPFIRPLESFLSLVDVNGVQTPRFSKVS